MCRQTSDSEENCYLCGSKMAKSRKKYVMNPETLMVDVQEEARIQGWQVLVVTLAGLTLFLLFM